MKEIEIAKSIEQINIDFLKDSDTRYFGYFSLMCGYIYTNEIPLIGVTVDNNKLCFMFNPDEWGNYSLQVQKELLKHEITHISFGHLSEYNVYKYIGKDERLLNKAMDLEINQHLDKDNLPEWGVFIENYIVKYPHIHWDRFAGSLYYYNNLLLCEEELEVESNPQLTHVWKSSEDSDESNMEINEVIQEIIANCVTKNAINALPENERESGFFGDISTRIEETYKITPIKVSLHLKSFITQKLNYSSTIKGKKIVRRKHVANPYALTRLVNDTAQKILVFIDESGSVSNKELIEFISIISQVCKDYEMELRPFDTTVGDIKRYRKRSSNYTRTMCGGTDLNCVLKYYNDRKDMNLMFVLTDGHFNKPKTACKKDYTVFISSGGTTRAVSHLNYKQLNSDMTIC